MARLITEYQQADSQIQEERKVLSEQQILDNLEPLLDEASDDNEDE